MAAFRKISRLRHRIEIQRKVVGLDSLGRQVRDGSEWVRVARVWAEIREVSGREVEKARQIVADATHSVTIRYREGVLSKMRLVFNQRVFEIRAVLDEDSSRRELLLLCGEDRK